MTDLPNILEDKKIAVCHENVKTRGGATRVAEELARTFDADLFIGFWDKNKVNVADDVKAHKLFNSWLDRRLENNDMYRDIASPWKWEKVPELQDYDIIIQSKNNTMWYVPRDTQLLVTYCHTPPRNPYDRFQDKSGSIFRRLFTKVVRHSFHPLMDFPDLFFANSELIQRRLDLYFSKESTVLYPPVNVKSYYTSKYTEDYYLTFSRLAPNKRMDEIVEAFNNLSHKLVIGGEGPQREKLEKKAEDNIEFVGYMDEAEKRTRLSECRGLIFNAVHEDFGLVPVESLSSGTPVLGVNEGFTKYQIKDGCNGVLYERGELEDAVNRYENMDDLWPTQKIAEHAERNYGINRFQENAKKALADLVEEKSIDPKIDFS